MPYQIRRPLSVGEQEKLGGFSPFLANLLFHRGIVDASDARDFISPNYESNSHDPFLLKDAEKAAERIIRALISKEKIAKIAIFVVK